MKYLMRISMGLALVATMFMAGCGQQESSESVDALSQAQGQTEALASEAAESSQRMLATLQELRQENRELQNTVLDTIAKQDRALTALEMRINELSESAGTVKQQAAAAKQSGDKKAAEGGGSAFGVIVIILIVLIIIFLLYKLLKPKPFEDDDDDDFSSFDDDFGFDDDDDDFGDDDEADTARDAGDEDEEKK